MATPIEQNPSINTTKAAFMNPIDGPDQRAPAFIENVKIPAPAPNDSDGDDKQTPEDAIKEPLTPVPAEDEINPPLSAILGGDDLLTPLEKN